MTQPVGRRKRPTLAAIASAAGVSTATVSKVLNGRDDVGPETRTAIQRLLDEHEYQQSPRHAPRRPARREEPAHRTIGLIFDDFMSPYATELIRGVTDAGTAAGADVVVGRFSDDASGFSAGAAWARRLVEAGRDGVLVVTSDLTSQHVAGFEEVHLPLVVVDPVHTPQADVASVGATNWTGAFSATEHLIALGHRRIAHLGGPSGAAITLARLHGYRAAVESAGLPADPRLVVEAGFGFDAGFEHATRLLTGPEPPTAVFAVTDVCAFGVVQAAHELGLRVPDDVSVVGFDDTYMARWVTPALTTVRTPLQDMGRFALEMLLRLVDGEVLDPHHIELATHLVVRSSTAPPPAAARAGG
ncbi:LacI family DNA-binding transcriptional regulator [Kineococcus gypseus]|uniref:LacI family DNA-binding transcriptional regulator n=1 Tax=Kineococcus gypseus TaxID=1637102 RepID=UPI003D7DCB06